MNRIAARVVVAAVAGACFTTAAKAEVKDIAFAKLAAESDLIVVARVTGIEDAPADLKAAAAEEGVSTLKIAVAEVVETWRGNPVKEVRYFASPMWMCDVTRAEKGERVVLFLEKRNYMRWEEPRFLSITHSGHGRMPLRDVGAQACAAIPGEVILPDWTATISEKESIATTLVDIGCLRELVKASDRRRSARRR